jgi:NTE family protein
VKQAREIRPDLVVGTSVGALNGVAIAAEPSLDMVNRLRDAWIELSAQEVFGGGLLSRASTLVKTRTHLHANEPLRDLIDRLLPVSTFEELVIPFQCVAASIERAAEHWFSSGPLADAVLASAAVPGLLPPVEIDGQHFVDGGVVHSIPIGRAVELGANEIYVLHVGRIERPLEPPSSLLDVATVTFEIARRHRFARDLAELPDGVIAHVLPTGAPDPPRWDDLSRLRYRDFSAVARRIRQAHAAVGAELDRGRGSLASEPRPS